MDCYSIKRRKSCERKNLTTKDKIATLKRGYKMCGELAPGGVKRKCANSALSVISGYVGVAFSGAIVDVVTSGSDLSYAVKFAVIFTALILVRGILDTFPYVSKAEQLDRGFEQNGKMLIAKKCMELDYVRIENPETHRLKERAETFLYKDFDEKGVEISSGEAQKLCLARAVYKGSPFIVLDEPTTALDPVSEHDVYTNFNSIVGTQTAAYISHRLSSCRFCDDIPVLDKGEIAERGSHDSLLSEGRVREDVGDSGGVL